MSGCLWQFSRSSWLERTDSGASVVGCWVLLQFIFHILYLFIFLLKLRLIWRAPVRCGVCGITTNFYRKQQVCCWIVLYMHSLSLSRFTSGSSCSESAVSAGCKARPKSWATPCSAWLIFEWMLARIHLPNGEKKKHKQADFCLPWTTRRLWVSYVWRKLRWGVERSAGSEWLIMTSRRGARCTLQWRCRRYTHTV